MSKRQWKNLNPATTYTLSPSDGWGFTLNSDGSVTLAYTSSHDECDAKSVDLSVDPDPGEGNKYPPTQP